MNALTVTWRLRAEMLSILAGCAPNLEKPGTERRLSASGVPRNNTGIFTLTESTTDANAELEGADSGFAEPELKSSHY